MHQYDRDIGGVSSPSHDSALCARQIVLLNQIGALTRDATIHNPPKSREIYTLKQEYNLLVKKRAKLARSPLSDPTEVLPSELWPDIIRNILGDPLYGSRYPINELLDLTSVSKGWCSLLTTLRVIWTQIWLDQREPDYLAKAMMCIQLSGECEIDLFIRHLTVDEWRGICSMIVPEGKRIQRLSFFIHGTDYMLTRQVLGDFTRLPVLQKLSLPNMANQLCDQQYLSAILKEKMPSIKMVDILGYTAHDQIWNPYLTYCYLQSECITKDAIEQLVLLPHLHSLAFIETAQTLEDIPSLLKSKSSFGSVTYFMYEGVDICRRLTWIGNNLSTLSTDYPENGDANALLVALSRFPRLHELTVKFLPTNWVKPTQNEGRITIPRNSVRQLHLSCSQDLEVVDWNVFFSILFPTSPCLEHLSVRYGGIITDMGWNSIQSIKNLRYLLIDECNINDSSSISLNTESLRHFGLIVHPHGLAQVLAKLQSKFLQTLWLTERKSNDPMASTPHTVAGAGISLSTVMTTPYIVAGSAFPNITSLAISNETYAPWELRGLSKLRELEVRSPSLANHMIYWASDILEAILTRPRDNPALEKITLTDIFTEWDILLLMLERRNFLNEPGISSIKTLVFNHGLPYRLLYPLSELLGGRFVERDSNRSFSLEAIGERMFNESLPGCMQCHYSFRECESALTPGEIQRHPKAAAGGDKANECLVADPPLPPEIKLWLSRKHERLINFVRRYEETGRQLHRPPWCNATRPRFEGIAITEDTLIGAHFGHDLQE